MTPSDISAKLVASLRATPERVSPTGKGFQNFLKKLFRRSNLSDPQRRLYLCKAKQQGKPGPTETPNLKNRISSASGSEALASRAGLRSPYRWRGTDTGSQEDASQDGLPGDAATDDADPIQRNSPCVVRPYAQEPQTLTRARKTASTSRRTCNGAVALRTFW